MNIQRIKAIIIKEFIHVIRDPRSLGMGIAIPILLLIFFGYALSMDVKDVKLIVFDKDNSQISRQLISSFIESETFIMGGNVMSYNEIEKSLNSRNAMAALIIPSNFTKNLTKNNFSEIQFIVDGSDANTARVSISYAEQVIAGFNKYLSLNSQDKIVDRFFSNPLELSVRILYNPLLESKNGVVPGLIAVIMMMIAAMLTSLTVAREWETGTMEQLISTPVRPVELIIGKLTPYFIIGLIDVIIAVITAFFLFHIPLKGDLLFLSLSSFIFLTGALMMGITISIITKNQLLASQIALVTTFLPAFLLSGFAYDIGNMPIVVRAITYIVPARYFVTILKSIFLKGGGIQQLWSELFFLIIYTTLSITIALKKLRFKID